jgi:hypothetical protein
MSSEVSEKGLCSMVVQENVMGGGKVVSQKKNKPKATFRCGCLSGFFFFYFCTGNKSSP